MPMIGNNVVDSGTGTLTLPTLEILVPVGSLLLVASAVNWPILSWSVLVTTENIPSAAEPAIGAAPVYVHVIFQRLALSVGVVSGAVGPSNAEENVQPEGCVVIVGMIELK